MLTKLFISGALLFITFLIFLACAIAPLYKNHEACRPEPKKDDDHE